MKKKTMVLGGLIAAVAITGYSVAGTYAKYVSSVGLSSGEGSIARWEVEAGTQAKQDITDDFIYPGKSGSYTFKLATGGDLSITSDTDYEVKVKLTIANAAETALGGETVADTLKNSDGSKYSPVRFGIYVGESTTAVAGCDNLSSDQLEDKLNTVIAANADQNITIKWAWAYDDNSATKDDVDNTVNVLDTKIGNASATANGSKLTIDATATVTQKNSVTP